MMQILVFFDHITLAELIPLKVRGEHETRKHLWVVQIYLNISSFSNKDALCFN